MKQKPDMKKEKKTARLAKARSKDRGKARVIQEALVSDLQHRGRALVSSDNQRPGAASGMECDRPEHQERELKPLQQNGVSIHC